MNKEGLRILPCLTPLGTDKVLEIDINATDNYFQVILLCIQHSNEAFWKVNFHNGAQEFVVIHCIKGFTDIKRSSL